MTMNGPGEDLSTPFDSKDGEHKTSSNRAEDLDEVTGAISETKYQMS